MNGPGSEDLKMIKGFALLAAAVAATVAVPASAATVVLTGSSTSSNGSLLYTSGTGANKVNLSAIGLTYTTGATPSVSTAVKYAEGLGINPTGDNRHTVDNSGALDFILLRFDRSVVLNGASFANNAAWYGNPLDTDATISFAPVNWSALGQNYASNIANGSTNKTNFFNVVGTPLFNNQFESTTTTAGNSTRSFNTGTSAAASTVWIIGASALNRDGVVDSFKLTSISFVTPTAPVPEPSTWALLIVGFGGVGAMMRKRPRARFAHA